MHGSIRSFPRGRTAPAGTTPENATVDSAGRITLSARKREDAGIEKDVWIIGDDDHIEIWNAQSYEETMESISWDDFLV